MTRGRTTLAGAVVGAAIAAALFFLLPGRDTELLSTAHPGLELSALGPDDSPWIAVGKLLALGIVVGATALAARWNILVSAIPALVLGAVYAVWLLRSNEYWTLYILERVTNPLLPFTVGILVLASIWELRRTWIGRFRRAGREPDQETLGS